MADSGVFLADRVVVERPQSDSCVSTSSGGAKEGAITNRGILGPGGCTIERIKANRRIAYAGRQAEEGIVTCRSVLIWIAPSGGGVTAGASGESVINMKTAMRIVGRDLSAFALSRSKMDNLFILSSFSR